MKCELCGRENAEYVGIQCGKYRVCIPCIKNLINTAIEGV